MTTPAVGSGSVVNEVELAYNDFRQMTTSYQAHGGAVNTSTTAKVQYAYADGSANTIRPASLTYPNGDVLNYNYGTANGNADAASRVEALIGDGGANLHYADYEYLGLQAFVEVDYTQPDVRYTLIGTAGGNDPDTGDIYRGLDRFGRVKDSYWYDYGGSADIDRIQYGYDRASNRIWRENPVAASQSKEFDELYARDGLHRLKDMARGKLNSGHTALTSETFAQCWTLDSTGNWKKFQQDDNGNATWDLMQQRTANTVNEITDVTETAGSSWATPAYDPAGNMTSVTQPAAPTGSYTAVYDAWNRLVKLSDGANTVQVNEYDARRYRTVRKDYVAGTLSETRHFYYSEAWQCLEERLGSSPDSADTERKYVWGVRYIDDLVLRDRDSDLDSDNTLDERLYALQDANWNVTSVADTSGDVQERYAYTAYGEPTFQNSSFMSQGSSSFSWGVLYAGYCRDAVCGLYAVRTRMYQPRLGTWLSRDPVSTVLNTHLYEYVKGQPLGFDDPMGLEVAGYNHFYPLYLGGSQNQPTFYLDEASHTAFHDHFRDLFNDPKLNTVRGYGDDARTAWEKMGRQRQNAELRKAMRKSGMSDNDIDKHFKDITKGAIPGELNDDTNHRGNRHGGPREDLNRVKRRNERERKRAEREARAKANRRAKKKAREEFKDRLCKKGKAMLPGPLGLGFAADDYPEKSEAKGTIPALFDEAMDSVPWLEWGKGLTEIVSGQDWFPDEGETSYFNPEHGEFTKALNRECEIRRITGRHFEPKF